MDDSEQMNGQLLDAVWDNDIETAKGWLDKGASVNTQDQWGWTVLMRACLNTNKSMVDLLLKRGAEVNRTTDFGDTALILAVTVGAEEITDLLLQRNADIMMKTCAGRTVFHFAAWCDRKTILNQLLVSHGTHCQLTVDVEDNYGRTPLYIAAERSYLDCVDVLLVHGANPEHKSHSNESPLDIAKKNGKTRIVSMMTEALTIRSHRYVSGMMNTISILKHNNATQNRQIRKLEKEKKELQEQLRQSDRQSEISRLTSLIKEKEEQVKELSAALNSTKKNLEDEEALEAVKRCVMKRGANQWYDLGIAMGYNHCEVIASTSSMEMFTSKLHALINQKHAEVGTKTLIQLLLKACKSIPYPIHEAVMSDVGAIPVS